MDRMVAILGGLVEENDVETRRPASEFGIPGEYTDMEISRVGIYSTVGLFYRFVRIGIDMGRE